MISVLTIIYLHNRSAALEKESMLRTKAMRERDEIKSAMRYYKFVVIRIRFPEGVILQGIQKHFDIVINFYCKTPCRYFLAIP